MAKSPTGLTARKPKSVLRQPLSLDVKAFIAALAKGAGHAVTGNYDELSSDGAEVFASLGMEGSTPQALLYLLLQRSMQSAFIRLLEDSKEYLPEGIKIESLQSALEAAIVDTEVDSNFFQNPAKLHIVQSVKQALQAWLVAEGVTKPISETIAQRLPGFYPYALHKEWQRNSAHYDVIRQHLQTPFVQAAEREASWNAYAARLQQVLEEGVFSEPFGLRQVYIPLNAYYEEAQKKTAKTDEPHPRLKVVVSLQQELDEWLSRNDKEDAVRAISGGPGSGKSSFAKIFAAHIAAQGQLKVLFVPLHLIDPTRDFAEEIGRFVREEEILKVNPMAPETREQDLLIILDGLDELASQGRAAAATARDFIRTVQQTVDRRNGQELQLRVLFCGREVVMQESESEFRRSRQVLTVLPYFSGERKPQHDPHHEEQDKYRDPDKLLEQDLRQAWWKNYGRLTGHNYKDLPKELNRNDLEEITGQPLLNYLLALSFCRGKLDFAEGVNLNQIYHDLVEAVYERGYEKGRRLVSELDVENFFLVLEEIGLAAWHGDGRSTTIAEIEKYCRDGGLGNHLDAFQDGAKKGITRLLAAFFFRQHGERPKGDHTFVFTHKSFGEYLTARRLVRAMQDIVEERERRETTGRGKGWNEADALQHWAEWCGPTALSPYIHNFLLNEIVLLSKEEAAKWQSHLARLFSYMMRHGMPMERLQLPTFQDALFQSRNAEEALLAALNACARVTKQVSQVEFPSANSFSAWHKRIQGQRAGQSFPLVTYCMSWLSLDSAINYASDFVMANLSNSELNSAWLTMSSLAKGEFVAAKLKRAILLGAYCRETNFSDADMREAELMEARLTQAKFVGTDLSRATLTRANLEGANLEGANLEEANLEGANLTKANFKGAKIDKANFKGATLDGAKFDSGKHPNKQNRNSPRKTTNKAESATPKKSLR